MARYLERNAYCQLLEWKNNSIHATLEVLGARQVGKTYLVNKFADECYKRKVYINLLDLSGELFMEKYKALWNEMKMEPILIIQCMNCLFGNNLILWIQKKQS